MKIIFAVICCLFVTAATVAQKRTKSNFKIVGYYSLKAAMTTDPATVPFDKMTHVNLWFMNPDTVGTFSLDLSAIKPFVDAAHAKNVKILPSIAGGGRHSYYNELLKDDKRAMFIHNLVEQAVKYNFDGIDVDIERRDIDGNYEKFAIELGKALHDKKKMITAAVAVFFKDSLTENALKQYDFVNVMSYDHTGPGRPENPGPHSLYAHAVADLEYFNTVMHLPREKMVLGVGFYGYGFGPDLTTPGFTMNYNALVTTYPGSQLTDQWYVPGGKIIYYNGIPTMKRKTALAKVKASGIMIWQILGDAPGDKSLLQAINEEAFGIK